MYITCVCVCLSVHVRNSERLKCVCGAVSQNDGHVLSWSYNWMTTDPATVPTPATTTHPNTHTQTIHFTLRGSQRHSTLVSNYRTEGPIHPFMGPKTKQCEFLRVCTNWELCTRTSGDCYLLLYSSMAHTCCVFVVVKTADWEREAFGIILKSSLFGSMSIK